MGELWLVDSMHKTAMPLHYASHALQCLNKYGKETNLKGTGSPASLFSAAPWSLKLWRSVETLPLTDSGEAGQ